MHQHEHLEVSSREHLRDVTEVSPNLIARLRIAQIVSPNLNETAILV